MDETHDLRTPKRQIVNKKPMPKKIFPQNEFSQKNNYKFNSTNDKQFDDAMQDLLNKICELEQDKRPKSVTRDEKRDSNLLLDKTCNHENKMTTKCDSKQMGGDADFKHIIADHNCQSRTLISNSGSIERLQQRQCELQAQLDELTQAAEKLTGKQNEKMKSIFEDEDDGEAEGEKPEEEKDELAEFHLIELQIDNELRISELTRQLEVIQEELRLRLFNRLLSNVNSNGTNQSQYSAKRDVVDSPSSSTFDEPTASSTSSLADSKSNVFSVGQKEFKDLHENTEIKDDVQASSKHAIRSLSGNGAELDESKFSSTCTSKLCENPSTVSTSSSGSCTSSSGGGSSSTSTPTNAQSDLDSAIERNTPECEAFSNNGSASSSFKKPASSELNSTYNGINPIISTMTSTTPFNQHTIGLPFNNHRNNSTNSDLERIEEDEEDCQDYYSNSDRFRTIYEEKLSPLIQGSGSVGNSRFSLKHGNFQPQSNESSTMFQARNGFKVPEIHQALPDQRITVSVQQMQGSQLSFDRGYVGPNSDNSFDGSYNVSSNESSCGLGKKASRPLTLYLPKPDEEIDLVEHIQALGHDLNIISSDLKLSSTCAQGYLWKSCSNNSKKWLKRYFCFDRSSKVLSYYENEGHLVKKNSSPNNRIPFEDISDVYVDHKLSGIGERGRSSKRKNYVFVLATIGRKYLLASSRAETMRAWIDTLFTAAKANDYLQQLEAIDTNEDATIGYET